MDTDNKNLLNSLSTLIALQIVTVIVLASAFWVLHQDLQRMNEGIVEIRIAGNESGQLARIENWEEQVQPFNAALGPDESEVMIITYSDFQCPFCKTFAQSTHQQLVDEFGQKVRMVFKHLPLEAIHSEAMASAMAAQCANHAGNFWEFHDLLFEHQDSLNTETFLSLGETLGMEEEYVSCVLNEETRKEVERDLEDARIAGVRGTPTFLINGEVLQGAQSIAVFRSTIASLSGQTSR